MPQLKLYTQDGWMDLDTEYIPRVVTAEHGTAADEALKALAVASRTFVLRAMRDSRTLGTAANPILNTDHFQVYAKGKPMARAFAAAQATAGIVGRYAGELVIANYVAGAIWTGDGKPGADPTDTEQFVTYNEGKAGAAVKPTKLSLKTRRDNRGCMSQNGAHWLAQHGRDYTAILRFFYGADLEIGPLMFAGPSVPQQPPSPEPAAAGELVPLAAAFVAVAFIGDIAP